jgi:hypothetical protein
VVEILAALGLGGVGVVGGGSALGWRHLRRANRLVKGRPTQAPMSWLWSLRRSAVLHRRLRSVCQLALASVSFPPPRRRRHRAAGSPLDRVAHELVEQALVVDSRLVAADRLGGAHRRRALAGLAVEVDGLALQACRLRDLTAAWHDYVDAPSRLPTAALAHELDAMEAALGELGTA